MQTVLAILPIPPQLPEPAAQASSRDEGVFLATFAATGREIGVDAAKADEVAAFGVWPLMRPAEAAWAGDAALSASLAEHAIADMDAWLAVAPPFSGQPEGGDPETGRAVEGSGFDRLLLPSDSAQEAVGRAGWPSAPAGIGLAQESEAEEEAEDDLRDAGPAIALATALWPERQIVRLPAGPDAARVPAEAVNEAMEPTEPQAGRVEIGGGAPASTEIFALADGGPGPVVEAEGGRVARPFGLVGPVFLAGEFPEVPARPTRSVSIHDPLTESPHAAGLAPGIVTEGAGVQESAPDSERAPTEPLALRMASGTSVAWDAEGNTGARRDRPETPEPDPRAQLRLPSAVDLAVTWDPTLGKSGLAADATRTAATSTGFWEQLFTGLAAPEGRAADLIIEEIGLAGADMTTDPDMTLADPLRATNVEGTEPRSSAATGALTAVAGLSPWWRAGKEAWDLVPDADLSDTDPVEQGIAPGLAATTPAAASGVGPPAAGTHVPQITAQITAALSQSADGATELALSPDELGHVRLRLEPDAANPDRMMVMITFERPETMDLFRRHAGELAEALRAAGYAGADIGFGQESGSFGKQSHEGFTGGAGPDRSDGPEPGPTSPRPLAGISLDLRL